MRQGDFDQLLDSVRNAGQIKRGKRSPSRIVIVEFQAEDIREIRRKLNRSQADFALMLGVSVATLQNWEQGRRRPDGPSRALLKVAAENPRAFERSLGA